MAGDDRLTTASFLNTNFSSFYIGGGTPSTDNSICLDCDQIKVLYNLIIGGITSTGLRLPAQNQLSNGTTTTTTTQDTFNYYTVTYSDCQPDDSCSPITTSYYKTELTLTVGKYYKVFIDSVIYISSIGGNGSDGDITPYLNTTPYDSCTLACIGGTTTTTTTTSATCGGGSLYYLYKIINSVNITGSYQNAEDGLAVLVSDDFSSGSLLTYYNQEAYPTINDTLYYNNVSPCSGVTGYYIYYHISLTTGYFTYGIVRVVGAVLTQIWDLCDLDLPYVYYIERTSYATRNEALDGGSTTCSSIETYSNSNAGSWTPSGWVDNFSYKLFYDLSYTNGFSGDTSKWWNVQSEGQSYAVDFSASYTGNVDVITQKYAYEARRRDCPCAAYTTTYILSTVPLTVGKFYYKSPYTYEIYANSNTGSVDIVNPYGPYDTCTLACPTTATVTMNTLTNITSSSVDTGGVITDDGKSSIITKGIVISESPTVPTAASYDFRYQAGSGVASWTTSCTGLTASTTYNILAYAVNSSGDGYSSGLSFSTTAATTTTTTSTPPP